LGGLQAALPQEKREKYLKEIYGKKYKSKNKHPKPLSYYIDVDISLPGCPINPDELEGLLSDLFIDKDFKEVKYPVCLECKAQGNTCLFVEDGFCLGPVTKGGCGAPCPSAGLRCYGCFGPVEGANLEALENVVNEYADKKYIKDQLELYFKNHDDYKEFKLKKR